MRIQISLILGLMIMPFAMVNADTTLAGKTSNTNNSSIDLKNDTVRINYSLGYQIGGDFKRQGVKMDAAAVIQGIEDALREQTPKLSRPEMYTVLRDLKSRIVAQQRNLKHDMQMKTVARETKFLEQNKHNPGVKVTKSGLQYTIIKLGTGKQPKATDTVSVNYRGTLTNNHEFDSSYERGSPSSFALRSVIKGWTEGLQLIKEGGKIKLFVPPSLAYGERGPLAHRVLVFDIELMSIGKAPVKKQTMKLSESARQ